MRVENIRRKQSAEACVAMKQDRQVRDPRQLQNLMEMSGVNEFKNQGLIYDPTKNKKIKDELFHLVISVITI